MKKIFFALIILLSIDQTICLAQSADVAAEQSPPLFNYQGRLNFNGTVANGSYDFIVEIYNTAVGGDVAAGHREINAVPVVNGVFSLSLDFAGSIFQQTDTNYLDLQVRPAGSGNFTRLTPRTRIGSSPYSTIAANAHALDCTSCVTDGQIASVAGTKVTGKVPAASVADTALFAANAQTAANAVDLNSAQTIAGNKTFTGVLSGNGSGLTNITGTLKWNVSSSASVQMQPNSGYYLTSPVGTTITLPASPVVGDVIRVMGKGSGGYTLAPNSGQSIVDWGINHSVPVWTRQYSVIASNNTNIWQAIAASSDGSKLVAVENPGYIATSTTSGQIWTLRQSDTALNYLSVASSSDGTKLIAGVQGGLIYTSADSGVTWTPRLIGMTRNWRSVASSSDGTRLVAANDGDVWVSPNSGISWTQARHVLITSGDFVASSSDGTKLVLAERGGHVYTSTDSGSTWTDRLSSSVNRWTSVACSSDGTKIVAVEERGQVWLSSDSGLTWTAKTLGPSGINTSWGSVSMSADGSRIAASAATYTSAGTTYPGAVVVSADSGSSWTMTGVGTSWTAIDLTGGTGTYRLSAAMNNGDLNRLYSGPLISTGVFDNSITGQKDSTVELLYIGNDQFAIVSSSGTLSLTPYTY